MAKAKKRPARKTPTKKPATKRKVAKRVKKDALAEYREQVKSSGVAELLRMSDDGVTGHVTDWISTQSLAIDKALGGRGIPCGRITEVFGQEYVGKSTLTDHLLAETQRRGGLAILVDSEESRDLTYMAQIGVDTESLELIQFSANIAEEICEVIEETFAFWGQHDRLVCVVWDSVASAPCKAEAEGPFKDANPAAMAKVLAKFLRRVTVKIARTRGALVCVNHVYEKMGGSRSRSFGDGPRLVTYGGRAMRRFASVRLDVKRIGSVKNRMEERVGSQTLVKVVKSRVCKPDAEALLAILHGVGVDNTWTCFTALKGAGVITTSGGWHRLQFAGGEPEKWQGSWEGFLELCTAKPELFQQAVAFYQSLR